MDPFGEYDDYELWQALQRVQLASPSPVPSAKDGSIIYDLDMEMGKDGTHLAVADRQLLCVARALLRDCTKFVVFEEAQLSTEDQDRVHAVMQDEFEESVKKLFFLVQDRLAYYANFFVDCAGDSASTPYRQPI